MIVYKKIIGYQIVSSDNKNDIPMEFYSFQILSKEAVEKWMNKLTKTDRQEWQVIPIHDRDIEGPTFIK